MIKKIFRLPFVIVGLLILIYLITKIGFVAFLDTLNNMNFFYVALAMIPAVLMLMLNSLRLKKFVRNEIPYKETFKIYLKGYLLNYASFIQGLGAGVKVGLLKTKKVPISRSAAGVSSEIIYDILFTLVVSILFVFLHLNFVWSQIKKIVSSPLIYAIILLILVGGIIIISFKNNKHIREYLVNIKESFRRTNFLKAFLLTTLAWLASNLVLVLFFKALNLNVNFWTSLGGICLAYLFGLISFIPGGLGVRDFIISYIYSISSIPLEIAGSIVIFNRIYGLVIVGILLVCLETTNKKNSKKEHPFKSKYFPYQQFKKYFKGKVLEIGCAEGNNTKFLKEKYMIKSEDLYCIENDPDKLELAKKRVKANFYLGDARTLPFEEDSFDFVYCSEVIEHLPEKKDHQKLIREIKRVLKPKSYCIITTPNKKLYHFFSRLTFKEINPTHITELTYKEFKELLGQNFNKHKVIGIFGVFGPLMKIKTIRKLHFKLMEKPNICKSLIGICKND